jgi:hypothetical protein
LQQAREAIEYTPTQKRRTAPSLRSALEGIWNNFKNDPSFTSDTASIVFFSQQLDETVTNGVKSLAERLTNNGYRLVLIGLGDVDPNKKYLQQLTDHYTIWADPRNTVLNDWPHFIWNEAYGCSGDPPPTVAPPGPDPTITFPVDTTTVAPGPTPCAGKIVVMLDTSKTLTPDQFTVSFCFNSVLHLNSLLDYLDYLC